MVRSFTDWDADPNYLSHHGIKGMKHGVRRYQNADGSLTTEGKARYGVGGKGASGRKMQRDINNLDRGYANVMANKASADRRMNKYANKGMKYAAKKGLRTVEEMRNDKRMDRYGKKMAKAGAESKKYGEQARAVEGLQWRILGKAGEKGYSVSSKPVKRWGTDNFGRGLNKVGRAVAAAKGAYNGATGKGLARTVAEGAVLGGAVGAGVSGHSIRVDGQQVKIRKTKKGQKQSVKIVNYAHRG